MKKIKSPFLFSPLVFLFLLLLLSFEVFNPREISLAISSCLDFAPAQEYGVGSNSSLITAADMDLDGIQDLVTIGANGISVLKGNGDGSFQPPLTFSAPSGGNSISVTDLNSDNKPDVVTAGAVLLGNGDGTLQPALHYTAGTTPGVASVGDWNEDGRPDLAVTELNAFVVWTLLGNGDGTFQTATRYDVGPLPTSVAAGDFNLDGNIDLAVSTAPKALPQENGPGTGFAAPRYSRQVTTASFTYGDSPTLSILLGNGDGTFQPPVNSGNSGISLYLIVADFNQDGKPDIVDILQLTTSVAVRLGNGDGTFQPPVSYPVGNCPKYVSTADFNNDGKQDLITADQGSRSVSILPGNGDGSFQPAVQVIVWRAPISVATVDFNGDGLLDLAAPHREQNNPTLQNGIAVRLRNADNTPPTISNESASPAVLSPANQRMVPVTINYEVSDNCTSAASVNCVLSVTSSEPVSGAMPGDKSPDWQIIDPHHVQLRAERVGQGNGRVYTVTVTCSDVDGNASAQLVTVIVP